jgi:4'-phosphopantetheinyl transferase
MEVWRSLLAPLPVDIMQKVEKYRRWQDAYGCLLGKLLLLAALREEGFPGNLSDLKYTVYGRPYLENGPDFNISHSGNRVVCILGSQGGVGIDLEEIRELAIGDFKDQFTEGEWKMIVSAPVPLLAFYHFWTAKECIIKADGRGLNLPLGELEIPFAGPEMLSDVPERRIWLADRCWNIYTVLFSKNYACHIAAEEQVGDIELREFSIGEIYQYI